MKCQCGCGKNLTGQQRKWASDAGRKRASRRHKKSVRFHAKMSGQRPLSPGRIVQIRLIIDSDGLYPYLYDDRIHLMLAIYKVMESERVLDMLAEELMRRIPGYKFKVVILAGRG